MLLAGQADYEPRAKELLMMDVTRVSKLDKLHSPRVLNTHLPFTMLPAEQMLSRRLKVVHVYRNPRDVMVSMYHHLKQFRLVGTESVHSFVKTFLAGEVIYGHYARYLNQMNRFMNENPELPIYSVSYEDMKSNATDTVRGLAEYLEVPATEVLIADIVAACAFHKLKKVDETKEQVTYLGFQIGQKFYRKGEVGDWENHLTEEEVEMFDREFYKVLDNDRFQFRHKL
nr:hypothetical protein BaRGS_007769 [Batillaria attramentaria]